MTRKSRFRVAAGRSTRLLLFAAMVSVCGDTWAEDVIMYRDRAPAPGELADVLFPPAPPSPEPPKMRMRGLGGGRGLRVTGASQPLAAPSSGSPATAAGGDDSAKSKPAGGKAVGFNIHFALNSADLLPETLPYLDSMGKMLTMDRTQGVRIRVTGHADASGKASHNLRLSEARAAAVKEYLVKTYGVTPERLETIGYGEGKPLPGTDPYDAVNRRVEFHPLN